MKQNKGVRRNKTYLSLTHFPQQSNTEELTLKGRRTQQDDTR